MKMLLEIESLDRVAPYLHAAPAEHKKIMGFGHRVHRVGDPRAAYLRQLSRELSERAHDTRGYEMSLQIEQIMRTEKGLYANTDLYSASSYYLIGLPLDLYPPFFAVSRIAGWTAHVLE